MVQLPLSQWFTLAGQETKAIYILFSTILFCASLFAPILHPSTTCPRHRPRAATNNRKRKLLVNRCTTMYARTDGGSKTFNRYTHTHTQSVKCISCECVACLPVSWAVMLNIRDTVQLSHPFFPQLVT